MIAIKACEKDSDFLLVKQLVKNYIRWLNIDLSFQDVDKELSDLSSMYGPPDGIFLLAWDEDKLAGGVGLRALAPGVCEMKRLYVYDQFKNKGIGRRLCTALIQEARNLGYDRMRLDTLDRMASAIELYKSLGFKEIEPYRFNPDPTTRYMELSLGGNPGT
jgi:GNAT superfamily N-acetyltransferase